MPAFGRPTSPMSAISRSSRRSQRSSPGSPFWACFGAWWVEVLKWVLPRPPRPPRAIIAVWPTATRSASELAGLVVEDRGAGRDVDRQLVAGRAVAARARAAAARRRLEVVLEPEVAERRLAGVDPDVDRAASAAVAAVGAAPRNVRLGPERGRAVTARAGLDEDLDAVEKHQLDCRIRSVRPRSPRSGAAPADAAGWRSSGATGLRRVVGPPPSRRRVAEQGQSIRGSPAG